MEDTKIKQNVLQQIIKLMDEMEGDNLKSKSPKFMKIQMGSIEPKNESSSSSEEIKSDDLNVKSESKDDEENLDDEMIQKLEELLKKH